MAEVELRNVTRRYGDVTALDGVSLTVPDGSFVVLLGPTGAGKTTTLRMVSGLDRPDGGEVFIDGQPVNGLTPAQRNVAMVFQQYSLYPHLTVRENLEFPLKSPLLKTPRAEIDRKVRAVAETLQIAHKLGNKSTALSGGEMQRVSIGRALVRDPSVYLMDEPLSSLDAKLRADLRIELKSIQADSGATLLYVTHDQIEAMTMATHVGVLEEGRLIQFGPPREIYEDPVSIYAASRLGQPRINILPADLFGHAPGGAASIGLRPEQIVQTPRSGAGSGTGSGTGRGTASGTGSGPATGPGTDADSLVTRIEHLGDQTRLHLKFRDHEIITVTDAHTSLQAGDIVAIEPRNPFFFDANGARIRG